MHTIVPDSIYKGIGILPGNHVSYIDHLVPLCHLLEIPLLITDIWIKELIEWHYPPMHLIYAEAPDYNLDPFLKEYDLFVYVDYFRKGNGTFQFKEYTCSKRARSLISLHGHPDKFGQIYWLENLCDEDLILVYGPQLRDLLKKKGIRKTPLLCGNYRLEYYKKFEEFFDRRLPFQKQATTLLYAPTWSARDRSTEHQRYFSPCFNVCRTLFDTFSEHYQLIVKFHPHAARMMPDIVEQMMEDYPHICFLQDYPPIYPLLKQIDLYLGDYSSIGYDFLYFDRPLLFLETEEMTPLQHYGTKVVLQDFSAQKGQILSSKASCAKGLLSKKEFYHSVFGDGKELALLKKEVEDAYREIPK